MLIIIGGAANILIADRKRKPYELSAAEIGGAARTEQNMSVEQAVVVASRAIRRICGGTISVGDGPIVVGWIGQTLSNIPSRQAYELIVLIAETGEGSTEFRCIVRPRFSNSWGGTSRSVVLRNQLMREINSIRPPDQPPPTN